MSFFSVGVKIQVYSLEVFVVHGVVDIFVGFSNGQVRRVYVQLCDCEVCATLHIYSFPALFSNIHLR